MRLQNAATVFGELSRRLRPRQLREHVLADLRDDVDVRVDDLGDVVADRVREKRGDLGISEFVALREPL